MLRNSFPHSNRQSSPDAETYKLIGAIALAEHCSANYTPGYAVEELVRKRGTDPAATDYLISRAIHTMWYRGAEYGVCTYLHIEDAVRKVLTETQDPVTMDALKHLQENTANSFARTLQMMCDGTQHRETRETTIPALRKIRPEILGGWCDMAETMLDENRRMQAQLRNNSRRRR